MSPASVPPQLGSTAVATEPPATHAVAVVALGDFVDVLDATPLARQLAVLEARLRCVWFTTPEGARALRHNQDVHEVVVLEPGMPREELDRLLAERTWRARFDPLAAPTGFVPRGLSRFERMRLTCKLPWTQPPLPILRLDAQERAAARHCVARLPKGPKVLVECEGRHGERSFDAAHLERMLRTLAPLEPTVLLASSSPPGLGEGVHTAWPRTLWFHGGPRCGAEVLNACDLFVGAGGPFSAVARTDWVRPELARIERCADTLESSAGIPHLEDLTVCRDDARLDAALARATARLLFAPTIPPLVVPREGALAARSRAVAPLAAATRAGFRELALLARGPLRRPALVHEVVASADADTAASLALRTCEPASLDVVLALHVLHTLADPIHFLALAHDALAPAGVLLIAGPNGDSYARAVLGDAWPWREAVRHFDATTLRREVESLGFRIESMRSTLGEASPETVLRAIQEAEPGLAKAQVTQFFTDLLKAGRGEELVVVARKRGLERAQA